MIPRWLGDRPSVIIGRRRSTASAYASGAQLLPLGGWVVLVPLSLIALARFVAWDSTSALVALNALTPFVFLPAWPVAVVAGLFRRWILFAAAVGLVASHVSFVLPELLAAEAVPSAARTAPSLRLFNANVYAANHDVSAFAEEIRRSRPDIVVLQEATPAFLAGLESAGALADLPHRVTVSRRDPFAAAVASRWALTEDDVVSVWGRPVLLRASIQIGGIVVRLFAFHAVAPAGVNREEWTEDLASLGAAISAERRPILIAGDFNATWGHRHFRRLLDLGVTDAAAARGKPYQMTWPRNRRIIPPLIRIDHVLTTERLVMTRISTGVGKGSDHRPLVADVALT